mmetsp:Transcript_21874/g.55651  ORF Transcript_21874/g.55651 Transcript_21874/m.55651 type:complete len:298 (+) Transcript_21874:546-1439(+)
MALYQAVSCCHGTQHRAAGAVAAASALARAVLLLAAPSAACAAPPRPPMAAKMGTVAAGAACQAAAAASLAATVLTLALTLGLCGMWSLPALAAACWGQASRGTCWQAGCMACQLPSSMAAPEAPPRVRWHMRPACTGHLACSRSRACTSLACCTTATRLDAASCWLPRVCSAGRCGATGAMPTCCRMRWQRCAQRMRLASCMGMCVCPTSCWWRGVKTRSRGWSWGRSGRWGVAPPPAWCSWILADPHHAHQRGRWRRRRSSCAPCWQSRSQRPTRRTRPAVLLLAWWAVRLQHRC